MTTKRVVMLFALFALVIAAVPAMAQQQLSNDVTPPPPKVDAGDTSFVLISSALVLLMTIPGLALFYGGMVRTKNVLGTLMQSFILVGVISIQWVLWGYSISFATGGSLPTPITPQPYRIRHTWCSS
jgi:ammonium transporter, Amt family